VHCSSYQDQDPLGEIADSVAEVEEGGREARKGQGGSEQSVERKWSAG